ncbi:MAG TPA: AbrB/MazE/SpoVT family DNA-binding domain-containing protein [Burkholderiales bacterium]|nr:AbrB/MazE/SpoVT family DNA-binding domain-containing protein [Burkholderiales bacterium]
MHKLHLTHIGGSIGLILPEEMLAHLKLDKGDAVFLTEIPDGYTITPYDAELDDQLRAGHEIMLQYREIFLELAE